MSIQPYYSDSFATLYHGDCREIDAWLAADVLVTDPPYGVAYESNMNRDRRNAKVGRPINGDTDLRFRDTVLALWGGVPPSSSAVGTRPGHRPYGPGSSGTRATAPVWEI